MNGMVKYLDGIADFRNNLYHHFGKGLFECWLF